MRLSQSLLAAGVAVLSLAAFSASSKAAFTVTIQPDGLGDIVANGTGTLNLSALHAFGNGGLSTMFQPNSGSELIGPIGGGMITLYPGITAISSFGGGGSTALSGGSGDLVGLYRGQELVVPQGYTSGSPLSDSAIFDNATLATLGVTPGTYTSTWGSGASADSYTIAITNTAVPEPTSLGVLAIGSVGLLARRRRKTTAR